MIQVNSEKKKEELRTENKTPIDQNNIPSFSHQAFWYFFFAFLMVLLNMLIQNIHLLYIVPFIKKNFSTFSLINTYYLSTTPYNMPELWGSIIAVVITYITKFLLDKFIVFKRQEKDIKTVGTQFSIYFFTAILTTLENLSIQFFLGLYTSIPLNIRIVIALTCGYITKFFLDRKYSFSVS